MHSCRTISNIVAMVTILTAGVVYGCALPSRVRTGEGGEPRSQVLENLPESRPDSLPPISEGSAGLSTVSDTIQHRIASAGDTAGDSILSDRNSVISDTTGMSVISDTTGMEEMDFGPVGPSSVPYPDSTMVDSLSVRPQGSMDAPAFSAAKDSVIEDFSGGRTVIYYYGDVSVTYGNLKITSDFMAYDVDNATVFATGLPDTAGVMQGKPVMTEGDKSYEMEECFYNFDSRKAKVRNAVTKESEGILHGNKIKMMPDRSVNISGGKYTVCDAPHPHYYLKMTTAKVETEPKQKTVFGPAYVVLADVPLPLAIPFGFVPSRPEKASGILFPTFGEEEARGFYLQDGGFYFALGDYADVAFTGSYYTLGSYSMKLNSRYKVRYKFDGSLNINFSNDQTGEKGQSDFFQTKNFGVQWSHSQDSKAHPGTSFRASVNFSSPSNSRFNERTVQSALTNQTSSSISYSRTWSKASLSVNALHSQNTRDSSYVVTFPNVTFTLNRFNPFKKKERSGKEKWYEQFSLSYNTTFQNKVNFKSSDFGSREGFNLLEKLQSGMSHKFAIGLPTFTAFKYLTFSPSINYGMNWFFQSSDRYYNPQTDKVETITTDQFGDFGITQDFSASLSLGTRIYGTFVNKRGGNLMAVRHVITPSVAFSYKPEHGTMINGYRTYSYLDSDGVEHTVDYNKWSGGMNSVPGKGQTASLSFSFGNNLEAKVVDKKDTTGVGTRKVKLIDQLNLSGNYNFLADSSQWALSNIAVSMNTNIAQKVGLHGSMTLDPYAVDEKGVKSHEFNIVKEGGFNLVRLTNASASLSFNISGKGKTMGIDGSSGGSSQSSGGSYPAAEGAEAKGAHSSGSGVDFGTESSPYMKVYYHPVTGEYIPGGWIYYMNTDAPWSLNFNYNFSYAKSYSYANNQLNVKHQFTQTLGVSAQLKFTRDLAVNLNTGFDFTRMKLSTTQLTATYDLHCFAISVSYVPSGKWAQWSFRIAAKASALADLLQYKKSSSYWDNGGYY